MQRKVIDVTKSVFLLEYIGHDHHSGKVIELSMSFKCQGHPNVKVIQMLTSYISYYCKIYPCFHWTVSLCILFIYTAFL